MKHIPGPLTRSRIDSERSVAFLTDRLTLKIVWRGRSSVNLYLCNKFHKSQKGSYVTENWDVFWNWIETCLKQWHNPAFYYFKMYIIKYATLFIRYVMTFRFNHSTYLFFFLSCISSMLLFLLLLSSWRMRFVLCLTALFSHIVLETRLFSFQLVLPSF